MALRVPFAFGLVLLLSPTTSAQITTKLIAGGLTRPLWAGAPRGDERVFIATKTGAIRIVKNGELLPTPFLNLAGKTSGGSEQGLLGVAFHPNYAQNGFFYVNYTDPAGDTVVARFSVTSDPDLADPASESIVLTQIQPFDNHNGGDLHFGPDGYLYVFFGDGGSANDPGCRAQKLGNLLGKVVRIDVDSGTPYAIPPSNPFVGVAGARGEIFHLGLRNPWRNSFDRLTGDLYLGDVGQDAREEISVAPAGSSGLNFGWKVLEGTRCNSITSCDAGTPDCTGTGYVPPIHETLHSAGAVAITGGIVYRGCLCPSEYGKYFFSDVGDPRIFSLEYDVASGTVSNLADRTVEFRPGGGVSIRSIASFGEDGFGELLILDESGAGLGEVFKMVPAPAVQATNVLQNGGGTNRACLTATSLPILGSVWEARVDSTPHAPPAMTFVFGFAAPSSGTFFRTQEILVDVASPEHFRLTRPSSGGADVFRAELPCDLALTGLVTYVQAVIVGRTVELCNALQVTLGHY